MKKFNTISKIQIFVFSIFANLLVFAQEKSADLKVDVDLDKGGDTMGGDWMSNPLVWVIGALVLILLVALIARGGGSKS